ncbi:hypothetical protein RMATCC62417_13078 [Rhizopus microsporus]|nr:hypothetical protein RMATCC62417_13078 [Rhizopus microsporus]
MKLATISLALLLTASNFVFGSAEQTTFDLEPDFRTRKNILFSAGFGGSSHVVWVLSILEELQARGHHTIYYTREDHAKFIKNAPSVELIVGAPPLVSKEEMQRIQKGISSMSPVDQFAYLVDLFGNRGIDSYTRHLDVFSKKKVDLAICDHFDGTCAEAAIKAKIPFIVTSTYAFTSDSLTPYVNRDMLTLHHPTVKGLSFSERLQDKVISPIRFILKAWPAIQNINKKKRAIGVDPIVHPSELPKDSFKLVNSFFGFEPSRPVGPLVEVIGPIIPKTHPVLNTDLQQFLDNHRRVVYVAFAAFLVASVSSAGYLVYKAYLYIQKNTNLLAQQKSKSQKLKKI